MLRQVVLVPLLPLAGAVILLLFGKRLARVSGYLATMLVAGSFVVSLTILSGLAKLPGAQRLVVRHLFGWMAAGGFNVSVDFRIDPLSVMMILVVTGVGMLIHWYAIGYMAHDEHRGRFFAYLNLFVFSMLLLVLAGNFLVMYTGWELVGLCSYLLISFYFTRPSAAAAGKKAFLVTRIGDLGMFIGLFAISHVFHSLDFGTVFGAAAQHPAPHFWATAIPLLLFCGAVGKSAQIPLYVWLPDAMEGPTPVSALIHAATMVTAGVYLVARCNPIYNISADGRLIVALIGGFTALLAATMACVERDIKRVLAYSTVSQLGYMMAANGAGAPEAAFQHLTTHGVFKALLFLGAGIVIHHFHTNDVFRMGGLFVQRPWVGISFLVGTLALAGVWPLPGFFSKEAVLAGVLHAHLSVPFLMLLATSFLTAFYMFRVVFLAFFGRAHDHHEHPEPPLTMDAVCRALAALTLALGLRAAVAGPHAEGPAWLPWFSLAWAFAGIALAWA